MKYDRSLRNYTGELVLAGLCVLGASDASAFHDLYGGEAKIVEEKQETKRISIRGILTAESGEEGSYIFKIKTSEGEEKVISLYDVNSASAVNMLLDRGDGVEIYYDPENKSHKAFDPHQQIINPYHNQIRELPRIETDILRRHIEIVERSQGRYTDFKQVLTGVSNVDPLTGSFLDIRDAGPVENMEIITPNPAKKKQTKKECE